MVSRVNAFIPYGGYYSTPFAKWQGSLANVPSTELAIQATRAFFASRRLEPSAFDYGVLGLTVPQRQSFYGLPWLLGRLGATATSGPTIAQACATSARCLVAAAQEIAAGASTCALVLTTDRTSNGPHLYYPNPKGPGGTGEHEDWVVDNFARDPFAELSMLETAENAAKKHGISTEEQHEVVLMRSEEYARACADDAAFLRRFMLLPLSITDRRGKKLAELSGDEGVVRSTAEGLAKLKPVREGGTVTYGAQTHPADGAAGCIVTTEERARELSVDPTIRVRLAGFGQARVDRGYMPEAPVPAARRALAHAGLSLSDVVAVKSHNPFALNDVIFARETGFDLRAMNRFGCSLVWGHPQAPTGMRAIVELVEELVLRGGGVGLFQGCAAGDSAMAVVVEVSSRRS